MKRILTLTAVAAMVFTACSKEESTGTGDKQVRITPTIANPALTPASMSSGTRATDTDFELNDKVGLTITMTADGSAFVANKEMSFDGTDFKTEGFLWYEDVDATSTLFAYYPYQAGAAAPAEFDQSFDLELLQSFPQRDRADAHPRRELVLQQLLVFLKNPPINGLAQHVGDVVRGGLVSADTRHQLFQCHVSDFSLPESKISAWILYYSTLSEYKNPRPIFMLFYYI